MIISTCSAGESPTFVRTRGRIDLANVYSAPRGALIRAVSTDSDGAQAWIDKRCQAIAADRAVGDTIVTPGNLAVLARGAAA